VLVATALPDGRLQVRPATAWDGHGHGVIPMFEGRTVTPGSRGADPITVGALIRQRIEARQRALVECMHRGSEDGRCPECGRPLPEVPAGAHESLRLAAANMAGRGVRGTFRVVARGASLEVWWCTSAGSRTDVTDQALAAAIGYLRVAGLAADIAPGLGCALLSRLPAAEERGAAASVHNADADETTARECELLDQAAE
jgi:hypothetical protein